MASELSRGTSRDPNQRVIGNFFKSSELLWLVVCNKSTRTNIYQVMPVNTTSCQNDSQSNKVKSRTSHGPAASSYLLADATHAYSVSKMVIRSETFRTEA